MLVSVDIDAETPLTVPIFGVTPKDSIIFRKITGLNPPDKTLFMGEYARDGGIYLGRRVGYRNVVILADLNPNPALGETVASLRERLYKTFIDPQVSSDEVKIGLNLDDGRKLYVVGYTEKFEGEVFDTETSCQVSLLCPDPYIRDDAQRVLVNSQGWVTVPFTYGGTAETGFEVNIVIKDPTSTLTVENNGRAMVFNRPFVAGEIIRINTVPGEHSATVLTGVTNAKAINATAWNAKTAYVAGDLAYFDGILYIANNLSSTELLGRAPAGRSGGNNTWWNVLSTPASLLRYLTATSPWLELHSQDNLLTVYGATTQTRPATMRQLIYRQAYWGI